MITDTEIAKCAIDFMTARLARTEAKRLRNQVTCESWQEPRTADSAACYTTEALDRADWCDNCKKRDEHHDTMLTHSIEEARALRRLKALVLRRKDAADDSH